MADETMIDIYAVGVLAAVQQAWHFARRGLYRSARARLRGQIRFMRGQIRERNWRSVRNSVNGYLAELNFSSELTMRTCGHGWTKRRAARRLGEYLARDNGGQL